MACTTHCTICGRCYEAGSEEQVNEHVRRCPRCVIVSALVEAQAKMGHAAELMIAEGGDYETHGRQMRGAAGIINGWLKRIEQTDGQEDY